MKTFAIDIRLIGKKRTGDEAVFLNLTREMLGIDKTNTYILVTDINNSKEHAIILGRLGCIGQQNVKIISLRGRNRFVWNLVTLPWFLFHQVIDVYHTQYILPFFIPSRTKVVTHIHDVSFCAYPSLIGWKDRFFLWLLIPSALRRSALIVAPSQFTKDEIMKYYGTMSEKITVIPNALGIDFSRSIAQAEDVRRVREKYGLPETYLLYVGTFQPRKNIPFLIEVLASLRERLPELKLVLVGNRKGHHTDVRLERSIHRLTIADRVVFPGFIDQEDLPAVMRGASVSVFPSLYEGFGIPLLEAMSQDTPVVAADIPSLREVAGDAAWYFGLGEDSASLASAAEKLYTLFIDQKKRESLILAGKERITHFSWQKSAQLLLREYERLSEKSS